MSRVDGTVAYHSGMPVTPFARMGKFPNRGSGEIRSATKLESMHWNRHGGGDLSSTRETRVFDTLESMTAGYYCSSVSLLS